MSFLTALQFLTSIPVTIRREISPRHIGRSLIFFPVIGLIIGLILAGLSWLVGLILPQAIVSALLLAFLALITGALHLDGFIDTFDGIAGHKSVEERWRVMHDSRAGGIGIAAVALLLLIEYVSLNSIPISSLLVTLVLMTVISRWAMVYAIFVYPYARPSGLGKAFKERAGWLSFTIATIITLAIVLVLAQLSGFIIILCVWVIISVAAAYFKHKFSGLTGDTYGAINEVAEVSVIILAIILI